MTTLGELSDSSETIELGGRTFRLGRYRVRHLADLQRELTAKMGDPLDTLQPILNTLTTKQQELLLNRVYHDLVQRPQLALEAVEEYLHTIDGMCHAIWQGLHDHQPEISREEVANILKGLPHREFSQLAERCFEIMGLAEGNWASQAQGTVLPG